MRIASRRYCFSEMSEEHLPRADHHEAMKKNWFHFWKPLRDAHLAMLFQKEKPDFLHGFMVDSLLADAFLSAQLTRCVLSSPALDTSHPRP